MKVAVLGLGNMGSGIAKNILKAGLDLTVWNRTTAKTAPLVELGANAAETIAEAVSGADVVVTSLMDDKSVLDAVQREGGILENLRRPDGVHVCVTTVSPDLADELFAMHRKGGVEYVACPVLGRPNAAADGSLRALVAGTDKALEAARPVIESFASTIIPMGSQVSQALTMKLCINYSVVCSIEFMGEIYACAEKAGLNLDQVADYFKSVFGSPVFRMYADKIKNRDFDDGGFVMTGGLKDVQLMLSLAKKQGARFEIGEIVEGKMIEALAAGNERKDWSATYEVTRSRANLH